MLDVFQQGAGAAADNHRGLLGGQLLFEHGHHLLQVVGVHHGDTADANGVAQGFQIHGGGGLALDVDILKEAPMLFYTANLAHIHNSHILYLPA